MQGSIGERCWKAFSCVSFGLAGLFLSPVLNHSNRKRATMDHSVGGSGATGDGSGALVEGACCLGRGPKPRGAVRRSVELNGPR